MALLEFNARGMEIGYYRRAGIASPRRHSEEALPLEGKRALACEACVAMIWILY